MTAPIIGVQNHRFNPFHHLGSIIDLVSTMFEVLRRKPRKLRKQLLEHNLFNLNCRRLNKNMKGWKEMTHGTKLDDPWSRKLATASWSPSCVSKVLGGLESPIAWNFIRNYRQQNSAAPASSASLCFHAKLPAKLAFVPYLWASSRS